MTEIDTTGWKPVGESANTDYFHIEPGVLGAVPRQGSVDDLASARDNVNFQNTYWREHGGGVVVVFVDRLASQDKDARRIYQSEPDLSVFWGTALVGGSLLGRAIGSFFLGIARPAVPLKMCATLDDALLWARSINQQNQQARTERTKP